VGKFQTDLSDWFIGRSQTESMPAANNWKPGCINCRIDICLPLPLSNLGYQARILSWPTFHWV